jgi:hypothetical protein
LPFACLSVQKWSVGARGRIGATRVAIGVGILAASCGSRTQFGLTPEPDSSTVVVTGERCTTDRDCRDDVACTLDACDPAAHVCVRTLRDATCDDGVYCNGDERCDVRAGCVSSPRNCADAVDCTNDACDEELRRCVHEPNDTACPISHACDPNVGCDARAFAHDNTTLYDVRIPSGEIKAIGSTNFALTDVALHPSNVLYGISSGSLLVVDQKTGNAMAVRRISSFGGLNAADVGPDGTLYVAGNAELQTVDPASGALTHVMTFPPSLSSSGDLAFVGDRLVASAAGPGAGDQLVEFDLGAHRSKNLGPIGFACVWGLAAYGTTLYGLTCNGELLAIDTSTGRGTELTKTKISFWGAAAR